MAAGGPFAITLYRRVTGGQSQHLLPLFFYDTVLERYRGRQGFTLLRTNTIGRLRREGAWTLDFGISPQPGILHVSLGDLTSKLPPEEREHWLPHLATPPLSENFARAQLAPGGCIDDGELRPW